MIFGKVIHSLKSSSRLVGILLLIVIFDVVINLLIYMIRPQIFIRRAEEDSQAAFVEVLAPSATPTPYKPIRPTKIIPVELPVITEIAAGTATPTTEPVTEFYGIDFQPGSPQIMIRIHPANNLVNIGRPILIHVQPGGSCYFEDHRACVGAFLNTQYKNIVFVTIHSGIGGEAESYRRAIEGLGLNRAAYSLQHIHNNLANLEGAQVRISQGDRVLDDFILLGTARVPPTGLAEYFRLPIGEALELTASLDPTFTAHLAPDRPMLIFETCGWKLPSEPWSMGVSSTTGSVYLGAIQKNP